MTDRDKLRGAFTAWTLTIEDVIFNGNNLAESESMLSRAESFGRDITDREHIDAVSKWFSWGILFHATSGWGKK